MLRAKTTGTERRAVLSEPVGALAHSVRTAIMPVLSLRLDQAVCCVMGIFRLGVGVVLHDQCGPRPGGESSATWIDDAARGNDVMPRSRCLLVYSASTSLPDQVGWEGASFARSVVEHYLSATISRARPLDAHQLTQGRPPSETSGLLCPRCALCCLFIAPPPNSEGRP
jgi:hypothetical protein